MDISQTDTTAVAFPIDYQGAERGVSWIAMHTEVADDVFVPGTYQMTDEAKAEQAAVIAAEEERRRQSEVAAAPTEADKTPGGVMRPAHMTDEDWQTYLSERAQLPAQAEYRDLMDDFAYALAKPIGQIATS